MLNQQPHFVTRFLLITCLFLLSACDTTPKPLKTWSLAPEGVFSAAISKDGRYALLGSTSGKALLWDLKKPKTPIHAWQHQAEEAGGIIAVALSADHKYALTAERNSLAWWDTSTGETLGYWPIPDIYSLSISRDGQKALIGLRDQAFYFSLQNGTYFFTLPHKGMVYASDLSDDGRYALTGSDHNKVKLWSLSSGKPKHSWSLHSKPYAVSLSPNGKLALTNASSGETIIRKTGSGKVLHILPPQRTTLSVATFSANSRLLATARIAQRIDLWKIKSGTNIKYWRPQKSHKSRPSAATVLALEFTNREKRLTSITSNGIIQQWKVK